MLLIYKNKMSFTWQYYFFRLQNDLNISSKHSGGNRGQLKLYRRNHRLNFYWMLKNRKIPKVMYFSQ